MNGRLQMVCSSKEPDLASVDCGLAKGLKHLQRRFKIQLYTQRTYELGSWVVLYFLYAFLIEATPPNYMYI